MTIISDLIISEVNVVRCMYQIYKLILIVVSGGIFVYFVLFYGVDHRVNSIRVVHCGVARSMPTRVIHTVLKLCGWC